MNAVFRCDSHTKYLVRCKTQCIEHYSEISFRYFGEKYTFVVSLNILTMANKDINRIKVVLVEQKKTAKWLAEELGKDPATVSKWCTNLSQPSLETLVEASKILGVDVRDLLISTKDEPRYIRID